MELQFEQTAYDCLKPVISEVHYEEQTQEVRLPEHMPDIGKVLASWGQVLLRGKEWRRGGMTVSGGCQVWVMYEPEDGSETQTVESWVPFQMRWDFPETQKDGTIVADCLLRGVDARSVSARKLMVRCGICANGQAWEPMRGEVYSPGKTGDDIQLLQRSYPIRVPREAGEKTFSMEEELTIPASAAEMEKILRYEVRPELIDQKVMAGKVVFRGSLLGHILYKGQDGQMKTWDYEIPFSQYGDLERVYDQEAEPKVTLCVTGLELEPGEDHVIRMKAGLTGQYVIYDQSVIEVVEDAYGTRQEVRPLMGELAVPTVLDQQRETVHADVDAELPAGQIVDVAFLAEHPGLRRGDGSVDMEIPGQFQVLYYDDEGKLQGETVRWDGKWSLPADQNSTVKASVCLTGRPSASFAGNGVSLHAEVAVHTVTNAQRGMEMVTGLELGEEKVLPAERPSLVLRRAGEGQLWELAKTFGSTVEAIRKLNHLQDEPAAGQMLLIPVP